MVHATYIDRVSAHAVHGCDLLLDQRVDNRKLGAVGFLQIIVANKNIVNVQGHRAAGIAPIVPQHSRQLA